MTRKGANTVDRQNSEISYYADDEDGNRKKYTKRGKLAIYRMFFFRILSTVYCVEICSLYYAKIWSQMT